MTGKSAFNDILPRTRERMSGSGDAVVGVRDEREEARTLDRGLQLALVLRLGAGDAARHDLAGFGQVLSQGVEILVIDLGHAFGSDLAELAAAEELGHWCAPKRRPQAASAVSTAASAVPGARSSSSRRRRSPRSGLSPFASLLFMISDCPVSAPARFMTRWRRTAWLK